MSPLKLPAFLRLATVVAVLLLATVPSERPLRAGDYHEGAALDCGGCHQMHFQAVPESLGAPTLARPQGVGALLRDDVNELCLTCHDGSPRASDVLGPNSGRGVGDVRQAGYLNRLGRVGQTGTGHTLGSNDVAPGSVPPWSAEREGTSGGGLNCIHCHSPHGSEDGVPTYRNLRSDAGNNAAGRGRVTYNHERPGTNDPSRDVFVRSVRSYDESAIDFNEPDERDSAMARFCAGCHDLFHGVPGDTHIGGRRQGGSHAEFLRHPTAGVNIGARGDGGASLALFAQRSNRVKVMSASGAWEVPVADLTPTCISCHKAHGNGNPFGLIFRSGRGQLTENGDTGGRALEDLCGQCHDTGQAVFASAPR